MYQILPNIWRPKGRGGLYMDSTFKVGSFKYRILGSNGGLASLWALFSEYLPRFGPKLAHMNIFEHIVFTVFCCIKMVHLHTNRACKSHLAWLLIQQVNNTKWPCLVMNGQGTVSCPLGMHTNLDLPKFPQAQNPYLSLVIYGKKTGVLGKCSGIYLQG